MFLNKKFNLLFLLIIPILTNAQKIIGDVKFSPKKISIETIDTVNRNVYYDYTFSFDNKNTDRKKSTTTILQIGNKKIGFTDFNYFEYDSLSSLQSKKEFLNADDINNIIPIRKKINFQKSIVKSIQEKNYTLQAIVYSTTYKFTEQLPILDWQLKNEKKEILNYNCKEATVHYKGRNWIAFYTEEIPISDGPYLFNGLPGLILEIYDDKNEHHFLAKAIDEKPTLIYLHNEKDILTVSKDNFYKAERNFHENPGDYIGKSYSSPNVEDKTPFKAIPYNPIELN